ncbi:FecR family protein [Flavitalea sp.]|nr:FecR domain-containing protein [Flavitalea sp.]
MQELFRKYLNNQCSPEEVKEFLAYFNNPENESQLRELISETLENIDVDDDGSRWSPATDESLAVLKMELSAEKSNVVPIYRKTWVKIAVAAILLVGAFSIYNLINNSNQKKGLVITNNTLQNPGSNKATLTLADGSSVILANVPEGIVTEQGQSQILKTVEGELAYKKLIEKPTEVLLNTLATPRGGKYQLILADGSKVWLNAATSLRFPAAFVGTERKVELNGEAYFEVAKNASMPFKVAIAGKGEVEVLGTHFNVNAYIDETTLKTTLLEGSVKVTGMDNEDSQILNPGEQAQVSRDHRITINKNADIDLAIAWKNGAFNFSNADVTMVMRQLSRWYDVDIVFEGSIPQRRFNGEIQRDLKLSQVLKLLEKNNIYCRLNGKTLIVQKP